MSMFQILVTVLFIISFGGGFIAAVKAILIFKSLRNDNLIGNMWGGTARMKDLNEFLSKAEDELVKNKVALVIKYLKLSRLITWVGFCLIVIVFLLNGLMFK